MCMISQIKIIKDLGVKNGYAEPIYIIGPVVVFAQLLGIAHRQTT